VPNAPSLPPHVAEGVPRLNATAERLVCAAREARFSEGHLFGDEKAYTHERRDASNRAAEAENALREYIFRLQRRYEQPLAIHATV